jgi:hypothetical protein
MLNDFAYTRLSGRVALGCQRAAKSIRRSLAYGPFFVSPKSFAKNPLKDLAGTAFR